MENEFIITITFRPGPRSERWTASSPTSNHASLSVNAPTAEAALRKLMRRAGECSIEDRFRKETMKP